MNSQYCLNARLYASLAVVIIAGNSALVAQEASSENTRSLSSAPLVGPYLIESLENNPILQAYERRYQAGRESIESARALPNPRIQISHFVESIQTRTGPQRQAIQLQQPLPPIGARSRRQEIASAHAESLWHAFAIKQFEIVDQLAGQFFEIAYLSKAVALAHENTTLLRQLESLAEERVGSGGSLNDLLRLQLEIQRLEDRIAELETGKTLAALELSVLLGRTGPIAISDISWSPPEPLEANANRWLEAAETRNPQIALLSALRQSQEARARLAKLAARPDFNVGVNYIRTGDAVNPSTQGSGQDPWAVFVGVSLPIWKSANNAVARAALLEAEALDAEIDALSLQIDSNTRKWTAKLNDSMNRIQRFNSQLIPLARQSLDITEANYRARKSDILDIIEAERTLIQLETNYWRAAADAWLARWKLATLSGGLWLN